MSDEKATKTPRLKGQQLLQAIEDEYTREEIPEFGPGDTVEVGVRIQEGDTRRVQNFTGVCIARKGSGAKETFTVRRLVQNEGVERIFPVHCPSLDHIKVVRRGQVRRAKLHYLRGRTGRSAKVNEKRRQPLQG
jgi:large subunit ribosomal protein L19